MKAHIRAVKKAMPCITIDGKDYPLNLSVYATEHLGKKYGSLEKMADALAELPDYKQFSELIEIFHLMMDQGAKRQKRSLLDKLMNPIPSVEKMKVKLGMMDADMLYEKLTEAVSGGSQTTIEVAEKNATAMQGMTE